MHTDTHLPAEPALAPAIPFSRRAWTPAGAEPVFAPHEVAALCERFREPAFVVQSPQTGAVGVAIGERIELAPPAVPANEWNLLGWLPPLYPEWLGDRSFLQAHGVRFPYVSGAMANGIATTRIVIEMARAGFMGFFGAAGLSLDRIQTAIGELSSTLGTSLPWGANLIHSPQEPALEEAVADFYLRAGVRRVSAAAFMSLTPAIVRYALTGLSQTPDGQIVRQNHVFAKISRAEVARPFLTPAPAAIVEKLVQRGQLTAEEARLAQYVPVAEDIIVESDSGGHTDNRPLGVLFPIIRELRDELRREHRYTRDIRVGAAGGLGNPAGVAAAFSMGAAFVLTGTVNQACIESGLDASGKELLAQADMADVIMAPAADMFEMGVEVQVLRRGTMFAARGRRLYELYRTHGSLDEIPSAERTRVEKQILQATFDEAWANTRAYWQARDPHEIAKAEADPKHKMALVFRAYLGQSSRWAIAGDAGRKADYQIWCGPAMGAFNRWTKGTFLEAPQNRTVVQVALNLMEGAAAVTRAHQLRSFGAPMPADAYEFKPRPLAA